MQHDSTAFPCHCPTCQHPQSPPKSESVKPSRDNMNIDIWDSYEEINKYFELSGERELSEDRYIEHHDLLIVGIRKWKYNDLEPPRIGSYEFQRAISLHDKYDILLYTRG